MSEAIFSYGTLQDPKVQSRIIGRILEGSPDALLGYRKSIILLDGTTYSILVPEVEGRIEGKVLLVTQTELIKVDIYETDAYKRIETTLESGTQAWVYVKPDDTIKT